ncbi:DUF4954 domain-containing protein [candidate division KSB1 bacterium]|nr:MAG: DUF4954 domain-containing protein [candidate division KSB1 bacterium]
MNYRKLNNTEIDSLLKQGCSAENWDNLLVKDGFVPERIINVHFAGKVKLGIFKQKLEIDRGISKPSGLYNSYIQDCTIDDNVYISDVKNLAHYDIANNVVIESVNMLTISGETSFGNGTVIEILNEGGGRELPIFDELSSQIAYLMVIYRHDNVFIEKLQALIDAYVSTKRSTRGVIQQGSKIINNSVVHNVNIGEYAVISGALHLEEGTIRSCKSDPVFISDGVVAKEFIILSGARVDDAAILDRCFVGQGVRIGKQFSAENSAFFANCEGFHGEASSIFAGPYTVTHHKSTLLIAGLFSFYNAGSGTNQSNHMYKLGPVHQGILERGAKTGSFSYMMWPCRVGAFTGVIGKHYANFDTADLPFSYILESEGKSVLMPAMNLSTVGTRRDSAKWPNRDRRKDPNKLDLINFELLSPYTVGKMLRGIKVLKKLEEETSEEQAFVEYNGVSIKRPKLKVGYENYEMAIKVYLGNEIVKRLEKLSNEATFEDVKAKLMPEKSDGRGNWVDLAGMLAPQTAVENLLKAVRTGQIATVQDLINNLKAIYENYDQTAWSWCIDLVQKQLGIDFKEITPQHLVQIVNDWKESSLKLNNMILKDAEKEFDARRQIGFGIDGDEVTKARDFEAVRGTYEENKFVAEVKKESITIQKRAERVIALIEKWH